MEFGRRGYRLVEWELGDLEDLYLVKYASSEVHHQWCRRGIERPVSL